MSIPSNVRNLLRARADNWCELCGVRYANNAHHRKNRSQNGRDTLSNLLLLCGSGTTGCHGYVTEHPADSVNKGWSVKSHHNPDEIPVKYRDAWVYLDDVGGLQRVEEELL